MPGVDAKRRLRETCCPECGKLVGILTPPRIVVEHRMDLRRARHFNRQRAWCLGSGGIVPTSEIIDKIGAPQAVP